MKYLKLSKTSWIILAAGLFIVIMAGLGITRSQQSQEGKRLKDELDTTQQGIASMQIEGLQAQLDELLQTTAAEQAQLDAARTELDQTVVSVDVTDKFFSIASTCGVMVVNLSTSPIVPNIFEGIGLSTTLLSAVVEGATPALIDFVESLNNDFATGLTKSSQIDIPPSSSNETSSAMIQLIIYSYEGNDNG